MRHGLMYLGSYEKNFHLLAPGATTFLGSDDSQHQIPAWPAQVDGLRVGYMEKAGKKFAAVRVQDDEADVILQNELIIDPPRHLGYGNRLSHEPTVISDETAEVLLDDVIARNPEQKEELRGIRYRIPHLRRRPFT